MLGFKQLGDKTARPICARDDRTAVSHTYIRG